MKKIFCIAIAIMMILALCACEIEEEPPVRIENVPSAENPNAAVLYIDYEMVFVAASRQGDVRFLLDPVQDIMFIKKGSGTNGVMAALLNKETGKPLSYDEFLEIYCPNVEKNEPLEGES